MSLSQGYPSTFSSTEETREVLHNLDNETKKIYSDVNNIMASNGHAHTGNGSDGAKIKYSGLDNEVKTIMTGKNKIINGNFAINQRGVSGTVTLTAGAYGHDNWKAGASGCTYTFSTTNNETVLTITAGSLKQVIEGANLQSGNHILSWQGTAQGKIDSGSYSASGVVAIATGGTNLTVEFGVGTLSKAQLEPGIVSTSFEQRHVGFEELLCKRYCTKIIIPHTGAGIGIHTNGVIYYTLPLVVPIRGNAILTISSNLAIWNPNGTDPSISSISLSSTTDVTAEIQAVITGGAGYSTGSCFRLYTTSGVGYIIIDSGL